MNSLKTQSVNFKGYDARPLYAVVMRNTEGFALGGVASEVRKIGAEHGFKVLFEDTFEPYLPDDNQNQDKRSNKKANKKTGRTFLKKAVDYFFNPERPNVTSWIQDHIYFTKDGIIASKNNEESFYALSSTFNSEINSVPKADFIAGGNLYILKDGDEEKILVGASESLEKAAKMFPDREIVRIPQADFHIDLFVRPLKDNVILAADDDLTLDMLNKGADALRERVLENEDDKPLKEALINLYRVIDQMDTARRSSGYKSTKKVIKALEDNGFQVVRVPGRVYKPVIAYMNLSIENRLNFMNALAHEDKDGEVVYISNKSYLLDDIGISKELAKEIGLDFEEEFKKSIAQYVKPENVYFVEGAPHKAFCSHRNIPNILQYMGGGIHCLCAEVPKETVKK